MNTPKIPTLDEEVPAYIEWLTHPFEQGEGGDITAMRAAMLENYKADRAAGMSVWLATARQCADVLLIVGIQQAEREAA